MRWSKESVLLSGYDQASFAQHLDCDIAAPEIEQFLKECAPPPSEVDGEGFSNPMQCLRALRKAAKLPELPKHSPEFDDALRKLGRESLGKLCERTPDLSRVAELVWKLHPAVPASPELTWPVAFVGTCSEDSPRRSRRSCACRASLNRWRVASAAAARAISTAGAGGCRGSSARGSARATCRRSPCRSRPSDTFRPRGRSQRRGSRTHRPGG